MNINRLIWIDNIKCFAIILVVLGHLIQYIYFPLSFDNNHLFRYIYSFHMPLFMVISGILTGFKSEHTINKNTIYSIKKRAVQLIFPFLSWAIISSLLKKDYCLFLNIIKEPDNGLWFLWVLFFIYIAYLSTILIHKYINNFILCILIIYSGLYCYSSLINGLFGSSLVTKYYLYYMIGYLLSERNILNSKIISKTTYIIGGVIIFTILGYFWKRTGFIFSIFNEISYNKFINLPYRVITALVGIFTTIIIFMSINKSNYITTYIGQRTLAIYAIHFYIIELLSTIGNYNTYTIIVTLPMTIFASLLLEYILSLNRYTSLFLLGKNK